MRTGRRIIRMIGAKVDFECYTSGLSMLLADRQQRIITRLSNLASSKYNIRLGN